MSRIVFAGANLLDGENPARPGQTVVVEGNRIGAIGPDVSYESRPGDRVIPPMGHRSCPGWCRPTGMAPTRVLISTHPQWGLKNRPAI